ncbi:hypothetical protein Pan153_15890 [Gimesia panareensis]|uniref:Uncharacterized protein n=1 Tax=Gimesia panareensis TaxID=2527978 RepID=A0A518FKW6_9PLAN|nr:hypothetical protein Pan153_15890 [Gimesia panareensis]
MCPNVCYLFVRSIHKPTVIESYLNNYYQCTTYDIKKSGTPEWNSGRAQRAGNQQDSLTDPEIPPIISIMSAATENHTNRPPPE